MHLIHGALTSFDPSLPEVAVKVDRRRLAGRLWRAVAEDGTEFGVDLDVPLRHGDVVWSGAAARYVIRQAPEPVLEISLEVKPDAAAVLGWAVGNLHSAIEVHRDRFLAPDDPGLRQTLDRLGIRYEQRVAIFQPHRASDSLTGHGQLRDRTRESSPPLNDGHASQH
jgi:urease accessory protein